MNSDFENLKSQWQSLNAPAATDFRSMNESPQRSETRLVSAPGKIVRIYRRLLIVSVLWIPLSLLFLRIPVFPVWMCIVMALYFAVMSILNNWILNLAHAIDFSRMSVIEALQAVCKLQRSRIIAKTIGACLCLPLISYMIFTFAHYSQSMSIGGVIGGIVGLTCGIMVDSHIRREIRTMRSILEECTCNGLNRKRSLNRCHRSGSSP